MNHVVEAYVEDLRERYDISEREAASCMAYAPLRTAPRHIHEVLPRPQAGEVDRRVFAARRWGLRACLRTRTAAEPRPKSKPTPPQRTRV